MPVPLISNVILEMEKLEEEETHRPIKPSNAALKLSKQSHIRHKSHQQSRQRKTFSRMGRGRIEQA